MDIVELPERWNPEHLDEFSKSYVSRVCGPNALGELRAYRLRMLTRLHEAQKIWRWLNIALVAVSLGLVAMGAVAPDAAGTVKMQIIGVVLALGVWSIWVMVSGPYYPPSWFANWFMPAVPANLKALATLGQVEPAPLFLRF